MDTQTEAGPAVPALRIEGLSKTYPGTKALDAVSLSVAPGEVRALAGGNGSGKSTLIKVLAGVVDPDDGATWSVFGSESHDRLSPVQAHESGLRFVHQDPGAFDRLTLAENLAIGTRFATSRLGTISRRRLNAWAQRILTDFGITARPDSQLGELSQGSKTMVAIARAMGEGLGGTKRVLVLDEATASLTDTECSAVWEVVRRAADLGHSVIFITHRLDEILKHAHSVTVLRDGREVVTQSTHGLTESDLIASMLGRRIGSVFPAMPPVTAQEVMLQVDELSVGPLEDVTLSLRPGEVLGVAGLLGSGRTTLLKALFGEMKPRGGTVTLHGVPYAPTGPRQAMGCGVAYVPENRIEDAAYADLSVSANLSAATGGQFHNGFRFATRAERAANRDLVDWYSIKTAGLETPLALLSGGNQQKVVLARWMRREPRLLLLDEPSQGVDVGARADIYDYVRTAVSGGAAALVVASDFEELARISDRVIVIRDGHVSGNVHRDDLTAELLEELVHSSSPTREVVGRA